MNWAAEQARRHALTHGPDAIELAAELRAAIERLDLHTDVGLDDLDWYADDYDMIVEVNNHRIHRRWRPRPR